MHQGIYSLYLSDPEITTLISEEAFIQKMLAVEIALAKVQARLGIITTEAAHEIAEKLADFAPSPKDIASGTLANGIPTIPLLSLARKTLSSNTADYLHYGATSQDIIDTANVLMIREVLQIMANRLQEIISLLKAKSIKHEHTYMIARTRTQQAVPTSFGLKVHNWFLPLERHLDRLKELKARLLQVQFGGAGGNLAALDSRGQQTAIDLAAELELRHHGVWHNQRDSMAEFAQWLVLVSSSLGKMAQDILLLTQTEVGELIENGESGGKSSTMPHKNNPILSEAIVALAKNTRQLGSNVTAAMIHSHERDGVAWISEWLTIPQMMTATGTILKHAITISTQMVVCSDNMIANLEKTNGLVYSEQATFILFKYISRKEAKQKIGLACKMVLDEKIHFADALEKIFPDMGINWRESLQAKNYQGSTAQIINKEK